MTEKKRNWSSIKELLFAYLAISKMLYWISIIPTTAGFEAMWRAIVTRLLERDIVLIIVIVFIYFFETKFIMKQNRWDGILGQIMLAFGGFAIFSIIMSTYVWVINLILLTPVNIGTIFMSSFMREQMIVFFIIMGALTVKEHFKKKEAVKYALDIQSTNIKLEMLKELLDSGVLSKEDFDKQKVKLLEV